MKAVFILLALAGSCFLFSGFAQVAAFTAPTNPTFADTIGFSGVGVATIAFLVASVCILRAA